MPPAPSLPVSIVIPAYGAAGKLRTCLISLARFAPPNCPIFVLDDGTPDDSIAACCDDLQWPSLSYVRSDLNRGFVATCNWGVQQIAPAGSDVLLLNSDTEVTAGFLQEMHRVLYLNERHAVVTPRSNNATIFSIPHLRTDIPPAEAHGIWLAIKDDLPAYTVMPTAVGFCMLIKAAILQRFGLFDEIYSPGYNEENDFVSRINQYGFSAISANWSFVFHYESSTFGARRKHLEAEHRRILLARFPEFNRAVAEYLEWEVHPVERFSILKSHHRPSILFDMFHLPNRHSGTSEFGLNLLREVNSILGDEFELVVGLGEEGRFFSSELNGYAIYEDRPGGARLFDFAFKPSQFFTWGELTKLIRLAPRFAFVLQDMIAVRCNYLASKDRKILFDKSLQLADQVYTISEFTESDCDSFFGVQINSQTIHHGTNYGLTPGESFAGDYILLVGNNYIHKAVAEALAQLQDKGRVIVVGGDPGTRFSENNIEWFPSGKLARSQIRELMGGASVIVYPSYYEGYGLPIADALALGKPVIAVNSQVNRELANSLQDDKLLLIAELSELGRALAECRNAASQHSTPAKSPRRWSQVAADYVASFRKIMAQNPDVKKLRARHDLVRTLSAARHP